MLTPIFLLSRGSVTRRHVQCGDMALKEEGSGHTPHARQPNGDGKHFKHTKVLRQRARLRENKSGKLCYVSVAAVRTGELTGAFLCFWEDVIDPHVVYIL